MNTPPRPGPLKRCPSLATAVLTTVGLPSVAAPPMPPSAAAPRDDGQWTMPAKNFASTRYTELNEITTQNAKQLRVEFTFSTGVVRGHEAAPLVVNDTMYVVTPYPNRLFALDLTKPGALTKWTYEPKPVAAAQGVACCDVVNRGVQFVDGHLYLNLIYHGTGNPGPWNPDQRPGDNKWTVGIFARDADTAKCACIRGRAAIVASCSRGIQSSAHQRGR